MSHQRRNLTIAAMLPHLTPECWGIISANFFDRPDSELAMFLAQTSYESSGGKYQREVWGPTEWQKRYEGTARAWLMGNRKKGDGYKFRGWGPMQVTWQSNTLAASKAIFGDDRLIKQPELLDNPVIGAHGAIWYWDSRDLGRHSNNLKKCTKKINGACTEGAPSHVAKRRALWVKAQTMLA